MKDEGGGLRYTVRMLRRVARFLRLALFAIGVILLLCLCLRDDFGGLSAAGRVPGTHSVVLAIHRSQVALYVDLNDPEDDFTIRRVGHSWYPGPMFGRLDRPLLPHVETRSGQVLATIPLWLLAFLC